MGNLIATEVERIPEEEIIESGDVGGSGSGDKSHVDNENSLNLPNSQRESTHANARESNNSSRGNIS